MTTIAIVKNKDSIFIGADTRRTFEYLSDTGTTDRIEIKDGLQKVVKIKKGYIAGAGWEDLIFAVNNEIINEGLDNLTVISNKIKSIKDFYLKQFPEKTSLITNTSWILTHTFSNAKINAFHFHPIENKLKEIESETFLLLYPNGVKNKKDNIASSEYLCDSGYEESEYEMANSLAWIAIKIIDFSNTSSHTSKDFYLAKHLKNEELKEPIYVDMFKKFKK